MLTLLVVICGALVIMLTAAAVNRRREGCLTPHGRRLAQTTEWMMSVDYGAADCTDSDSGGGCDGGAGVATKIGAS